MIAVAGMSVVRSWVSVHIFRNKAAC